MSGAGGGFAGSLDGSFFKPPRWVDVKKPPGHTVQPVPSKLTFLASVLTFKHIIYSPNLIWLAITVFVYLVFPYDLQSARQWRLDWVIHRGAINFGVTFLYYIYWELALYRLQWSTRKFRADSWPTLPRMAFNLWYFSIGIAVYTTLEVMFMHAYASGKLPYMRDSDIFASPINIVRFIAWTAIIPIWRGVHFYFSHRLLHIRFLYKFVHSLHHRNIDVEPIAGLTMHPIEHLYYFSCLLPSLYFFMSPFHLLFNGMHLLLSPGASHSGWEDHVQSDQFHYVHHARFWCNYGSASVPLDHIFGTFRSQLKKNVGKEESGSTPGPSYVSKIPHHYYTYMCFTASVFAALLALLSDLPLCGVRLRLYPCTTAFFVAFGPVLFALWLLLATGDALPLRWPFASEDVLGKFGLHAVIGVCVGVVPVYHIITTAFAQSAYCQLWGCIQMAEA